LYEKLGDLMLYRDSNHLSHTGAKYLAPIIKNILKDTRKNHVHNY